MTKPLTPIELLKELQTNANETGGCLGPCCTSVELINALRTFDFAAYEKAQAEERKKLVREVAEHVARSAHDSCEIEVEDGAVSSRQHHIDIDGIVSVYAP